MSKYSPKTTSVEIAQEFGSNAAGKHVIITGSNVGLGFETARLLALNGAIITIACRSEKNGLEAIQKITELFEDKSKAQLSFLQLDLGSFASIRKFVSDYKASGKPINMLINNAGIMACEKAKTSDGLEMQFGVNHIGHFLLTTELLDIIKQSGTAESPSRIINLSSFGNYFFSPSQGIRLDDLNGDKYYDKWERYGSSKLANILFTKQLNKMMKEDGNNFNVIAVSVHPGVISETGLMRHFDLHSAMNIASHLIFCGPLGGAFRFASAVQKNTQQGTATTLFCALSPELVPGAHYADCSVDPFPYIHPKGNDMTLAQALWTASEQIVAVEGK